MVLSDIFLKSKSCQWGDSLEFTEYFPCIVSSHLLSGSVWKEVRPGIGLTFIAGVSEVLRLRLKIDIW